MALANGDLRAVVAQYPIFALGVQGHALRSTGEKQGRRAADPGESASMVRAMQRRKSCEIVTTGFGIRVGGGVRSRGRFATPAGFPRHDGTTYRGLRVRRWGLEFVHRSRAIFCRPEPNHKLKLRFATFASLYATPLAHGCRDAHSPIASSIKTLLAL
jgi:hypothetical protein